jgi:hypothetical protein
MQSLAVLKNWNGYVPATGTGELKEYELKWTEYQLNGPAIQMSKTVIMTDANWDYLHKYLRLDSDNKKLMFFKECEENGIGNALHDQKMRLLVNEVGGEALTYIPAVISLERIGREATPALIEFIQAEPKILDKDPIEFKKLIDEAVLLNPQLAEVKHLQLNLAWNVK